MFQGCIRLIRLKNIFLLLIIILLLVSNFLSVNPVSSFSVEIKGPIDSDIIKAGAPVHFIIIVKNFTTTNEIMNKQDVNFEYMIKSSSNELIYQRSDTKAVLVGNTTQTSFKETFYLPDTINDGFYTLNAKITSLDGIYSTESTASFEVVRVGDFGRDILIIFLGIGLLIAVIGFYYEYKKVSKMRVSDRDLEKYIGKKKK